MNTDSGGAMAATNFCDLTCVLVRILANLYASVRICSILAAVASEFMRELRQAMTDKYP